MKTLKTLSASAAILGSALTVAIVATPTSSNPTFASYATPEAGNTLASYDRPQGNDNVVTASFDRPQGNGNIITASFDAPQGNGNVVTASYAQPQGNGNVVTASYAQPQGNGNVVTAAVDAGATGRVVVSAADPTRYGVTQNSPVA